MSSAMEIPERGRLRFEECVLAVLERDLRFPAHVMAVYTAITHKGVTNP